VLDVLGDGGDESVVLLRDLGVDAKDVAVHLIGTNTTTTTTSAI
jgi:hypothetical protein